MQAINASEELQSAALAGVICQTALKKRSDRTVHERTGPAYMAHFKTLDAILKSRLKKCTNF